MILISERDLGSSAEVELRCLVLGKVPKLRNGIGSMRRRRSGAKIGCAMMSALKSSAVLCVVFGSICSTCMASGPPFADPDRGARDILTAQAAADLLNTLDLARPDLTSAALACSRMIELSLREYWRNTFENAQLLAGRPNLRLFHICRRLAERLPIGQSKDDCRAAWLPWSILFQTERLTGISTRPITCPTRLITLNGNGS
jgi:hypothetical protein